MMRKIIFGFVCVIICSACSVTGDVKDFDLVILNGRVMDPETGLDAVKNVGVKNGKIVSITQQELQGTQSIDARGLVVAPGFIDLHNHSQNPEGYQRSVQDGVTTSLELETGVFPITPWFKRHKDKARVNYGASVSHGYIRARVMGGADMSMFAGDYEKDSGSLYELPHWNSDKATPGQIDAMKKLVAKEIDAGGLGIGYHLVVTPGSDVDEMLDFYELSARKKVANFIHIRSLGQVSPIESGKEIIHAAKSKGASVPVVHINGSGLWESKDPIDMLYTAQKQGLDVTSRSGEQQ
jgi:N-acyl-D-glutamate deacylase